MSRDIDLAIENSFFETKEINNTYRKFLIEVKALKSHIAANSDVKVNYVIVDSQSILKWLIYMANRFFS